MLPLTPTAELTQGKPERLYRPHQCTLHPLFPSQSMSLPPLSSTSPLNWQYIAEGGANLVLAFVGQSDSPYAGRALRLRKRKKLTRTGNEQDEVPNEVDLRFTRSVVEPLLGKEQLPEIETVELEREWVERLVQRMRGERVRPFEREEEDEADVEVKEAVVVEDLLSGEGVLAVEIKVRLIFSISFSSSDLSLLPQPKWGFLPSSSHLSSATKPLKTSFCRFCMHRYHKRRSSSPFPPDQLASFLAEHNEGYCPLDLYSGDERRVRRAVESLFAGWISSKGEGNNLRIFLDGRRMSPQDVRSRSVSCFFRRSDFCFFRRHISRRPSLDSTPPFVLSDFRPAAVLLPPMPPFPLQRLRPHFHLRSPPPSPLPLFPPFLLHRSSLNFGTSNPASTHSTSKASPSC